MGWLSLSEIASMAGGRLIGADRAVESVTTDTRTLTPGQLFIALSGPRFDGHDFIASEKAANAAGVMVAREVATSSSQIVVSDTLSALQRLAAVWREQLKLTVVGLTGSNGKTTVKEMIAAILSREGAVLATRGNYNNHIGVPLTLLTIRRDHAYAVIEMGANHPGEIAALTQIARPDIALITNAAAAHLEGFGSIEGVAKAKGEIFKGLRERGTAVINADDAFADYWRTLAGQAERLTFGIEHPADLRWRVSVGGISHMTTPVGVIEIRLPLQGRHNALNAMAAAGVAIAVGARLESIKAGLESVSQVRGRLVMREGRRGARLLDDSYNANPGSLATALEVLTALPGEHWLVLGDMGELGANGEILHGQAGALARASGVTRLYTLGKLSEAAAATFGPGAARFDSHEALITALGAEMHAGVSLLIKGSRSMRMEQVVEALLAGDTTRTPGAEREHAA